MIDEMEGGAMQSWMTPLSEGFGAVRIGCFSLPSSFSFLLFASH